jgi:hypothetical protein
VGSRVQLLAPSSLSPAFHGLFPHRHALTPVTIRAPSPVHDGLHPNDSLVFIVGAASHGRAAISDYSYFLPWPLRTTYCRLPFKFLSAFVLVFSNFHTGSHVYDAEYAGNLSCLSRSTAFEWTANFCPVLLVQPLPVFPSPACQWNVRADGPWFPILFISLAFAQFLLTRSLWQRVLCYLVIE